MSKDLKPSHAFELVEDPGSGESGAELVSRADFPREPGLPEGEGAGAGLTRQVAAVLRYKWWIMAGIVLGTAVGVGAARFVVPQYEARATLWIETGSPQGDRTGPIRPQELLNSSSWIELLRSAVVLEPVVRDLNLFIQPAQAADSALLTGLQLDDRFAPGKYQLRTNLSDQSYVLEAGSGSAIERGVFGHPVGASIGLRWTPDLSRFPTARPVEFSLSSPREVSSELGDDLQAQLDRNGNFLRLTLKGPDPEMVARTLNRITEQYVTVAAVLKRARLDELVSILEQQVDYSEQRLRQAEIALEDFRVQTVTLPSERSTPVAPGLQITRDPVFGSFFEMQVQLESIRRDRDMIERALTPGSGAALEALRGVTPVLSSKEMQRALDELTEKKAELRALRYRYTDEHEPVQRLLVEIKALETETIPALGRQILADLDGQEQLLEERIASASTELERIPPRAIEEARLTRSVESADNLYTTLLRRHEEARLSAASSIPDVRVLDQAMTPRKPVENPKPKLILLAMISSLGLGVLGAILRDRTDRRLRYPDQVTGDLRLPILAAIPHIRNRRSFFGSDNRSQAQEAFRSLRLNIMHSYGSAGPLITTVTSPGPGDGKSFISANLGRALADIGKRTLIIDADTRRGQLHELFELQRKPGLIEVLDGAEGLTAPPIRATPHGNLFLLPSGGRVQTGPELLSSARMRQLVMAMRAEFDVIIVDSPPLGAGVDPFVLGTLTGSMLLVLRTGETDRELADAQLELLDRLPIRLLGAVLNGVPATREYRYYSYTAGYETWAEDDTPAPALLEGAR